VVHNHPSGDRSPSQADIQMTKAIVEIANRSGSPCTPAGIFSRDHRARETPPLPRAANQQQSKSSPALGRFWPNPPPHGVDRIGRAAIETDAGRRGEPMDEVEDLLEQQQMFRRLAQARADHHAVESP
jgi:RadC-like JAB domain-containing protein